MFKIVSYLLFTNKTEVSRKFGALMTDWLSDVNQYGCWCYFDEMHGMGRSKPVDELDQACKTLHNGYCEL